MDGISLSWRHLPESLIERHGLQGRRYCRGEGSDPEYQFLFRGRSPVLPVWYGDELRIFNWATPNRHSPLPRRHVIGHEVLHAGDWRELEPEEVEIPATFGLDKGIWYRVTQGVQGVLVRDGDGTPIVYVVTRAATHYYQVMTRNSREPVFIGETI